MLKHSSTTPLCSLAIQRLFNDAGFDRGEYQNVFLDINQVQALIEDPRMRAIKFIGHQRTGKILAAVAGEYMKKGTFELGGNDAFIVLSDANIDKAVEAAYNSRMLCNG